MVRCKKLSQQERCRNSDELFERLYTIWNEISEETVTALTSSMIHRVLALIESQGGRTKY